jgi:hypothetical protein
MAMIEKQLGQVYPTNTSATSVYFADGVRAITTSIRVCNTDDAAQTFNLFIVPPAGTAGVANAIYYEYNIPAKSTLADDGKHIIVNGSTIYFQAAEASTLTCTISGAEIS